MAKQNLHPRIASRNEVLKRRSPDRVEVFAEVLGWETYQIKVRCMETGRVTTASRPIVGIEYAEIRAQEVVDALEGAYSAFVPAQS